VVIQRVLERAALAAVESEPDPVQRRGITMVPERGVPVRQERPPRPAAETIPEAQVA